MNIENLKPIDNSWKKDIKTITEIQKINNSVARRDEFEKFAIAAENEINRLQKELNINRLQKELNRLKKELNKYKPNEK